jgi:hypothetical protein
MRNTSFSEVPLGAILPGRRQFIVNAAIEDEAEPLRVELPGQIVRCGTQSDFALKPWARVVSTAGDYRRSVIVTAALVDELALTGQLSGFRERIERQPPSSFAVRLATRESARHAFDTLEQSAGGCDCEDSDHRCVRVGGSLSVGFGWNDGDEIWTRPVAAPITLDWSYGPEDGAFLFTCHSVWFGWWDRSTACEGTCPGRKLCTCKENGRRRFNCTGWRTCWCA